MSTNRSVQSLSPGDFADVSSASRSSSAGLRRSVARSRSSDLQQNVGHTNVALTTGVEVQRSSTTPVTRHECSRASGSAGVMVSSTHTTPEFEQPAAGQRHSSSSSFATLSSRADSGGRMSTTSHGRQRSSSSLFSEDSVDARHGDRTSGASTDRQSTSSNDRTSLFRLPYPNPKRFSKRASSIGSVATAQSLHSPPQRISRFDFC